MSARQMGNAFLVFVPTIILFLQYQVNWLYEGTLLKLALDIAIFTLIAIFLAKNSNLKFIRAAMPLIFLVGVLVLPSVPKAIAAALIFCYGYSVVIKANETFNNALKVFFIVNGVVILLQNIGVDAIFYKFQMYSPNWEYYLSLLDNEEGYSGACEIYEGGLNYGSCYLPPHQSRACGIFPSTIYLAVFQFLIYGQFIAKENDNNRTINFVIGFVFALIASTVSMLLFLFSMIYLLRKKRSYRFQIGFLMGVVFLYIFLTPIFAENYSFAERLARIDVRFVDPSGNSALTENPVTFSILLCALGIFIAGVWLYAKKLKRFSKIDVFTFLIVVISPLLVHQILEDVRYWLIVGAASAQLFISMFETNSNLVSERKKIKNETSSTASLENVLKAN